MFTVFTKEYVNCHDMYANKGKIYVSTLKIYINLSLSITYSDIRTYFVYEIGENVKLS